jgi:hypothetical protein
MDIEVLLWSVLLCVLYLVLIWGAVWVINTYIIRQAPFIPDQFKQVLCWVVTVIAVVISFLAAMDFVRGLDGGQGHHIILFHHSGYQIPHS